MIKIVIGPKDASLMAFEVLSKVLKFTPDEYNTTQKKIKWPFKIKIFYLFIFLLNPLHF